jgi:hypothetical protein
MIGRVTKTGSRLSAIPCCHYNQSAVRWKPMTVTKSPNLTTTTATAAFQIVSLYQRVNVVVNITLTITGEFVDPLDGEDGVTGTENLYLYI